MASDGKKLVGCGVVLLVIGLFAWRVFLVQIRTSSPKATPASTIGPTATQEAGETMSAIRASKKIARAHVDSSTSCKFHDMPWYYAVTYLGNDKYRVTGEVEMQSIFGQTKTRKYVTTFVLLPNDEYDPDDVTIKWYDD